MKHGFKSSFNCISASYETFTTCFLKILSLHTIPIFMQIPKFYCFSIFILKINHRVYLEYLTLERTLSKPHDIDRSVVYTDSPKSLCYSYTHT